MQQMTIPELKELFTEQINALERVEEYLTYDGIRLLCVAREILEELETCNTFDDILNNDTITIAREHLVNDMFINRFNLQLERHIK